MKKRIAVNWTVSLALVLGLVGMGLRFWLFRQLDPEHLIPADHPADALSYGIAAVAAVCLGLLALVQRKKLYVRLPVQAIAAFAAALGILVSLFTQQAGTFAGISCAAMAALYAWEGWLRLTRRRRPLLLRALLALMHMLLPFLFYRQWSAQPQVQYYVWQVLAGICFILVAYLQLQKQLKKGKARPRLYSFLCSCGIVFSLMSLPCDRWPFYLGMCIWLVGSGYPSMPVMALPKAVRWCIQQLEDAGFETYAVGGCVRDALMGRQPHDYDLCTAATPQEICQVFRDRSLVLSGEKHGTIGVVLQRQVYEITTFRTEGDYSDSRHPDRVDFVTDIRQDLARRDFTANAIAYHPRIGYVDPFDGWQDIQNRTLRCVGDPKKRFREDALRILRAMRFTAKLRFRLEPRTEQAMRSLSPLLDQLARERVYSELSAFLLAARAEDLLRFAPILTQVIPELEPSIGFLQHSPYHAYDVFTHSAYVTQNAPRELSLKWAALLHDVAKPATFLCDEQGRGHFPGHAVPSACTADSVLRRLKAPTAVREQVVFLIEHHMLPLSTDPRLLRRRVSQYGLERIRLLVQLQQADCSGKGTKETTCPDFAAVTALLDQLEAEDACLKISDLAIDGTDLMLLGYQPGPKLGQTLQQLLEQVLEESLPNEKQALLDYARQLLEQ